MSWGSSLISSVDKAIPPDVLRDYLHKQEPYVLYRRRTAAGLQQGLDTYDWYIRWRPTIFWSSVAGAIASAAAGWARRKAGPEAWLVYATTGVACTGIAWVTRPTSATASAVREQQRKHAEEAAEAEAQGEPPPPPPNPVFAYLDARAARYDETVPGFPDATFKRIVSLPGMREQYAELPDLAKAVIV